MKRGLLAPSVETSLPPSIFLPSHVEALKVQSSSTLYLPPPPCTSASSSTNLSVVCNHADGQDCASGLYGRGRCVLCPQHMVTLLVCVQISLSSVVMPMVKMVPRGFTAAADAYLTPHIMRSAMWECWEVVFLNCCPLGSYLAPLTPHVMRSATGRWG